MELDDPNTEQLKITFFLGEKQIGNVSSYLLNELVENLAIELARATDFLKRYAPVPAAQAS